MANELFNRIIELDCVSKIVLLGRFWESNVNLVEQCSACIVEVDYLVKMKLLGITIYE